MSNPRPGWYANPADATQVRWWDGNGWTSHVQPLPQEVAPSPAYEPAMAAATVATPNAWPVEDQPATHWPVEDQPATHWPVEDQPATAWPATETTWPAAETPPAVTPSAQSAPAPMAAPAPAPPAPAPSAFTSSPSSFTTATDLPAVIAPPEPAGGALVSQEAPAQLEDTTKGKKKDKKKKDKKKDKKDRTKLVQDSAAPRKRLLLLIGGVVVAGLMVGAAVSSTGVLDQASSSSEPSDPSLQLFQGDGFSVEIPRGWEQAADPGPNVDVRFIAPEGVELSIGRSAPESIPEDVDETVLRQLVVDTLVQAQLAAFPGSTVISREAAELGGATSERVTIAGTAFGAPVRAVEDGAIHDGQIWIVGMDGNPEAVAAALPTYEKIVASFSFA